LGVEFCLVPPVTRNSTPRFTSSYRVVISIAVLKKGHPDLEKHHAGSISLHNPLDTFASPDEGAAACIESITAREVAVEKWPVCLKCLTSGHNFLYSSVLLNRLLGSLCRGRFFLLMVGSVARHAMRVGSCVGFAKTVKPAPAVRMACRYYIGGWSVP
jgi:hypothetical protein